MKKLMIVVLMLVALPVWGATFPTADNNTLVSADANGIVTVNVANEDWYLVQFCQDNLRAGCGNKIAIQPSSVTATSMTFQLDMGGVKDGQVAYNFRRKCDNKWLAIPDCRVKTGSNTGMGMSFYTKDIEESGGAHFVYTGSGIQPWSPIDASKWCDEGSARQAYLPTVVRPTNTTPEKTSGGKNGSDQGAVAVANNQSAAAAHNSAAATTQSAAATNSSTANTTSLINVNQVGGKGKKGGKNVAVVYAPNAVQKVQNNNIRGNSADVKVYANKSGKGGVKNVITYVGPSYQTIHIGVAGAENYDPHACVKCHSPSAKDDERARKMVLTQMSTALAKEAKGGSAKQPNRMKSPAIGHPVVTHIK